jgi:hypothetical protein
MQELLSPAPRLVPRKQLGGRSPARLILATGAGRIRSTVAAASCALRSRPVLHLYAALAEKERALISQHTMKLGGDGTGAGSRRAVARGDGHPPARTSQATLGVIRICPGDSSPADRAPGCTSRTCLGYQDRERGCCLGKSRTGLAMTLGSPLVRFAASPLPA